MFHYRKVVVAATLSTALIATPFVANCGFTLFRHYFAWFSHLADR